ncbi:hypothetical protein BJ875DRAFT_382758 [Amylocarpus encephaloides]|uniref:Telomerase reverse transcriptase n=1 Tax=Amylocarpus encephaloides TaxID=45428 RepID=A0A9P7YD60_9HELO|nr:hypothetical protein BJ875DRAFT_382758 [Amylocarpus encephaloides]
MFLDTAFNSLPTVTSNVHSAFIETATKMWTYAKCLPVGKQPGTKLLCKTITDLIDLAFVLMKSKGKNKKNIGYKCALSKLQVKWLAINAFKTVLQKRQSKYTQTLQWLETHLSAITGKEKRICKRMRGVVGQM